MFGSGVPVTRSTDQYRVFRLFQPTATAGFATTGCDADARFAVVGLPEGSYHVIAIAAADAEFLNDFDWVLRRMPDSQKVTLQRGASREVTLELIDR